MHFVRTVNDGDSTVTKLLASTGKTLGTFTVGNGPIEVAFDGANIWVTDGFSNNKVTKVRASDGKTLGTFTLGVDCVNGVAFDGANIWVTDLGGKVWKL